VQLCVIAELFLLAIGCAGHYRAGMPNRAAQPRPARAKRPNSSARTVERILSWLERRGRARNRQGMARYGIRSAKVFGVSMATMRPLVRQLGRDHALAQALWRTGWLEARILAGFVDDPSRVTRAQMERWCRDFDNWAVCDSTSIHLFSRTGHAWPMVRRWASRRNELERRAAFALLASLAVHDKRADDASFLAALPLIGRGAVDERHFVKKAVNWALRQIGKRNQRLNKAAVELAQRLAESPSAASRWIARDALRELTSTAVTARLARPTAANRSALAEWP
jgi:3-methyladenine DNA glycosylase AlkD